METMAERIKALREARGMSARDVARHLGMLKQNYLKYESGERNPKQEQVERLAKLFGCMTVDITESRADALEEKLNSKMVDLAARNFFAYEEMLHCWKNYSRRDFVEEFFLGEVTERGDWPDFVTRSAQLKAVFSASDTAKCPNREEKIKERIKFIAWFIDYFCHRQDHDTVLNEVKEALNIEDDTEARIQFACRVALPAFSILRDMALYCDREDADPWKALVLADNL